MPQCDCIAEPHGLIAMKLRADGPRGDDDISEMLRSMPIDDATVREPVNAEMH